MNITTIPTAASAFIPRKPSLGEVGMITNGVEYPVIESVPTAYAHAESLPDGTYVGSRSGAFTRYDSHQGYGYAVGIAPATEETLKQDGRTFGVWTDPVSGRKYIDDVVHVWTIQDAVRLARRHDQIAFWSFDTGAAISTANAYDMILPED